MTCIINPRWIQFVCRQCGRLISDCRPAMTANDQIPTIEEVDSCAICQRFGTVPKTDDAPFMKS